MAFRGFFTTIWRYFHRLFGVRIAPVPSIRSPVSPSQPQSTEARVTLVISEPAVKLSSTPKSLASQPGQVQNNSASSSQERPQTESAQITMDPTRKSKENKKEKAIGVERKSKTKIIETPPVICAVTGVEPIRFGASGKIESSSKESSSSSPRSKAKQEQPQAAGCSKKKEEEDHVVTKSNMAAVKDVVSLYQLLKSEWAKTPIHVEKCGELLAKLKVGLTYLMFLPTSNTTAPQQELLLARDILEIGAQWSIAAKDIPSFERYMAQLKCYYLDYRDQLPESAFKYQLLGLNLLFLLSQNRVAEFHTELELLPSDQIQTNVYIRHPLSLEQYLMEGSYNKIFLAKGNVPAESYNFFMDILLDTIRNEIAACLEKAYDKISLKEATRMLNLPNQKAIKDYGEKKNWILKNDNFFYFNTVEAKPDNVLPSSELAEQAINYARELEMIV